VRHQDLFLEFARLADDSGLETELDTEHNAKVALDWAETYGVLGLTLRKRGRHAWWSDPRGGEGDTVAGSVGEAWDANRALRLYESSMSPEGVDIEAIVPFIPCEHRDVFAATPDSAQEWALKQAINSALDRVQAYCHPHPYRRIGGGRQTGIGYVEGYSFTNLLGAMWLQMLWLVYNREPGRCLNPECRRIISIEAPKQVDQGTKKNARGKYRTRRDKQFCSRRCINRHYYLTKVEPRRRAERVRRPNN
jgi:hypothetical protein